MANPFVHIELHTGDLARAKTFYTGLFGWNLQDLPMAGGSTYTMINVGEGTGGGMMGDPGTPPHWLAYIGVEDAAAATAKAKSLGATVVQDVMEVGDYGWMSVLTDPTGAAFALWQAKTPEQRGGD
jgi:predicted enzyme related to lactoylglutathione lyase